MTSFFYVVCCVPFHSPLRADFPSRCHQPLQCPLVSPFGVPYRVEDSLLQNWCRSWTSQSTGTLAVVTDMHHRTGLPFVDEFRWVSPLHYLKNRWRNAVLLWCMLQAGQPCLQHYCAVVLHSCIALPPVGHSSHHGYHCCQLRRQSSCVSNFYRTFKVFIWLSLLLHTNVVFILVEYRKVS